MPRAKKAPKPICSKLKKVDCSGAPGCLWNKRCLSEVNVQARSLARRLLLPATPVSRSLSDAVSSLETVPCSKQRKATCKDDDKCVWDKRCKTKSTEAAKRAVNKPKSSTDMIRFSSSTDISSSIDRAGYEPIKSSSTKPKRVSKHAATL